MEKGGEKNLLKVLFQIKSTVPMLYIIIRQFIVILIGNSVDWHFLNRDATKQLGTVYDSGSRM